MMNSEVAFVTGAGSGVGRASALALAHGGAAVVCLDVDADSAHATAAEVVAIGREALPLVCDLADPSQIVCAAESARTWKDRLDVLVHSAGIGLRAHSTDVTVESWDRVHDVNLRAPFLLTQQLIHALIVQRGSIVAVSSIAGMQGWPYSAAYSASKAGLIMLMRSFAAEYGPQGVRINTVCPGGVDTPLAANLGPLAGVDRSVLKKAAGLEGQLAKASQVAQSIVFLASSAASHISGAVLTIDGGASA